MHFYAAVTTTCHNVIACSWRLFRSMNPSSIIIIGWLMEKQNYGQVLNKWQNCISLFCKRRRRKYSADHGTIIGYLWEIQESTYSILLTDNQQKTAIKGWNMEYRCNSVISTVVLRFLQLGNVPNNLYLALVPKWILLPQCVHCENFYLTYSAGELQYSYSYSNNG